MAVDVERNLLATLLMNGGVNLDKVEERLEPSDFSSDQHRSLYNWILDKTSERSQPDLSILLLENTDRFGGKDYLTDLVNYSGPSARIPSWASAIRKESRVSKIKEAANAIIELTEEDCDPDELAATSERIILKATSDRIGAGPRPIDQLVSERIVEWSEIRTGERKEYYPSGFPSFDATYFGWPRSYPTIIGGRTKMGKTLFMLSGVLRGAAAGVVQGVVSIEMRSQPLMDRLACIVGGVPATAAHLRDVDASARLEEAVSSLSSMPIYVDDSAHTVEEVASSIRRMKRKYGAEVVWVDYLQLIRPPKKVQSANMSIMLDEVSEAIRAVAKEENIAVVCMMQFNREGENNIKNGKRGYPSSTAFRGSDKPLFDAAIAFGLYREWHYHPPISVTNEVIAVSEQADMMQPFDLVCLACRYTTPTNLSLKSHLRLQRIYDEQDP